MTNTPNVTVIIPTYNYKQYIGEAIESINNQTYDQSKIEIVIVDDGSSDGTDEFIKSLAYSNVKYYYQKNQGKSIATSECLRHSNGEIIFNLDADDFFYPNKIQEFVDIFQKYDQVVHVGSVAKILNIQHPNKEFIEPINEILADTVIDGVYMLDYFYQHNILLGGGSTFAARRKVFNDIDFPKGIDMYTDEFLLLVTLSQGSSYIFSKPLSIWRVHGNNYSGIQKSKSEVLDKGKRLLNNSSALLDYLNNSNFISSKIKNRFKIIHANRIITFKENLGEKRFEDKLIFIKSFIGKKWPGWTMVRSYKFVNRLLPSTIFKTLKKIKR